MSDLGLALGPYGEMLERKARAFDWLMRSECLWESGFYGERPFFRIHIGDEDFEAGSALEAVEAAMKAEDKE